MAQLFQPTNITPDTRGAFGNGVANLHYDLPVSWQVNGNTAMTAFEITFYENDGSGDQLYTTGQLTDGCPFYGLDSSGNVQLFTYTVSGSDIYNAGMRNGNEYQMKITQYWGTNRTGVVEQISPSIFLTRFNPLLGIRNADGTAVGTTITTRSVTMVFGHSNQSSSGSLMWIRWMLRNGEGTILKDTGKLYGSVDPTFSYDGLLPGQYAVQFSCETEFGVPEAVPWTEFPVSYSTTTTGIPVTASRDCNGESAVSIRWPRLQSIPLAAGNGMTDNGTAIRLANEDSYLIWDQVNGETMDLPTPWTAVWSGSVTPLSGRLFTIMTESGRYYEVGVGISAAGTGQLYIESGDEDGVDRNYSIEAEWESGDLSCILTQGAMYWKVKESNGTNLYPAEALTPSDALLPGGLGGDITGYHTMDLEGSGFPDFDDIVNVMLHGPSFIYSFEILDHTATEPEAQNLLVNPDSAYSFESLFYIKSEGSTQDYNAGVFPENLQNATKISVYRKTGNSDVLDYVGTTTVGKTNQILDYAARSQQGPYLYYLYVLSSEKYLNIPSITETAVNPCFWNWTVLSCKEKDGNYIVESSYLFGKNLRSGSVSNNNQPGVFQNFTPYPTVMISPQNYQSGTLQSLIGVIKDGEYSDTIDLRDAIYNLSTTTNTLFLKNRKGDLLKIRPSGEITMETMDNTKQQAQTVSFPWAEVGDASGVAIYGYGGAS